MSHVLDSVHLDQVPIPGDQVRRRARLHCVEQGVDHAERRMFLEALGLIDEPAPEFVEIPVRERTSASECEYGHVERKPWCAPCRANWPRPPS